MVGNVGLVGRGAAAPLLPRDHRRRAAVPHDGITLHLRGMLRPQDRAMPIYRSRKGTTRCPSGAVTPAGALMMSAPLRAKPVASCLRDTTGC